ncbi:retinol dehydrogenase 11-like [Aethina tumida]|uniref:retinol dehydrogenase 11-like n=1 Tax=Aethina tumida TaxID=116153 RepID=UPI00096B5C4C|nr:retinol dehydrogenase 11-like [Aethina tumida]
MNYFIVALLGVLFSFKLWLLFKTKRCKSKVSLVGKTAIVTGANTGMGFETALDFAHRGAKVILACMDSADGESAKNRIISITNNPNVVVKLLDLSSLTSVRNFAKDINHNEKRLDILVNNAGVLSAASETTEDGLEMTMQINYFAPFLLTILLVDLLKRSAPSRIVNVSSALAMFAHLDINNLNKYQGTVKVYRNSKLCLIYFTKELALRLKSSKVSVFSVHPGVVQTQIFNNMKGFKKILLEFCYIFYFKTPEEGAQSQIYTAVENYLEPFTGEHFSECQVECAYRTARSKTLQKKIWEKSQELVKLKADELLKL